jgi:hypothetical protein
MRIVMARLLRKGKLSNLTIEISRSCIKSVSITNAVKIDAELSASDVGMQPERKKFLPRGGLLPSSPTTAYPKPFPK